MTLSRRKKLIIGGSVLALLLVSIVVAIFSTRSDTPEVTLVEIEVQPELRSTVTASGEIRPIEYINLTSEVQGRIEEIYVREGDQVETGQELVRLDPNQLQSSADAQRAAYDASLSDVQGSQSQIAAARNQYSQAQQGSIALDAAVSTALAQVASARDSVAQARQTTVSVRTDVDRAQVELNAASRELKRNEELLESGVISRLEYDTAKDRVETAQASLNSARARLKSQVIAENDAQSQVVQAQARVKEARARAVQQDYVVRDSRRAINSASTAAQASSRRSNQQLAMLRGQQNQRDKTLQFAPINGVIASIPSKVGQFATANLSSTPLLTIADMSTVNVEVKVDETAIDKVAVGQITTVKVDAFGDTELKGEVSQKTPLALGKSTTTTGLQENINTQEAKEFKVIVTLVDPPDAVKKSLRPGMSATAEIITDVKQKVIAVPIQAVIEKEPDDGEEEVTVPAEEGAKADKPKQKELIKGVFVQNGSKVQFVEVTTGIVGESDIEITSGLDEKAKVITGPSRVLNTLKDGDLVRELKKEDADDEGES